MEKPKRSMEEIQRDYAILCQKAGHTQYQIDALSKELKILNEAIRDLNLEAAALPQSQPASEPAPVSQPVPASEPLVEALPASGAV